ncbi:MAG: MarR family transcriptional regulator [Sphingomonadales bacterium]|nr:MAG: MarR family transcriptional regulator [Sphingomonadales bacterium]TNF03363.1 MAG: MarR family transcriptional regulator [Sphingomonadales bacterium]
MASISRHWQALGDRELARLGVSNSTGWCLVYLSRLGDDARQSDLARAVSVREATLVRTLGQLEQSGLIQRSPNPQDARANIMRITPKGQSLVAEIEQVLTDLRQDIFRDVNDDDLATTIGVLGHVDTRIAERRNRL